MAGSYIVNWDGTNEQGRTVASGVYYYQLMTDHFKANKKNNSSEVNMFTYFNK